MPSEHNTYTKGEEWIAEDGTIWVAGTAHESYTVFCLKMNSFTPMKIPCLCFDPSGRAFQWLHGNAVPMNFWLTHKREKQPLVPCQERLT